MKINENLFDGIAVIARPHGDTDGDFYDIHVGSRVPNLCKHHFICPDFSQLLNGILASSNIGKVVDDIITKESCSDELPF